MRFLLTRLLRGATERRAVVFAMREFLLTRLLRGATLPRTAQSTMSGKFLLTRLLRGATFLYWRFAYRIRYFYSRASCEARPASKIAFVLSESFLLARLLRGATTPLCEYKLSGIISTHAPLARRDLIIYQYRLVDGNFYSRASCEARQTYV